MTDFMRHFIPRLIGAVFSLALTLLEVNTASAFINVEAVRKDMRSGFSGRSSINFSGQSGNTEKLTSATSTVNGIRWSQNEMLLIGNLSYGESANVRDTHNGQLHLRYSYYWSEATAIESFVQGEFDTFRALRSRTLAGTGLRQRVFEVDGHFLYLGAGAFYERENLDNDEDSEVARGNLYLSYLDQVVERISLSAIVYYQPLLNEIADYRTRLQSGLEVGLTEILTLNLQYQLLYDNRPPTGVERADSLYLVGFGVKY